MSDKRTMPFSRGRKDAGEAFGAVPPPHAEQAFGASRAKASRRLGAWVAGRASLLALLLCLALAAAALVRSDNIAVKDLASAFSAGSGGLNARGTVSSTPGCTHGQPPELATLSADQMLYLRAVVQHVASRAGGQDYASGSVYPDDAWTDDAPDGAVAERAKTTRWPGSYEIREWAPDPQWGAAYTDDIVADAFVFHSFAQARVFFMQATSVRCRQSAWTLPAGEPPDARDLKWVNPDGATEEDVYLHRGRVVYRLADVRPQNHEPPPSRAEDRAGLVTLETIACAIPRARCRPAPIGTDS
jgi:hypothetical protein